MDKQSKKDFSEKYKTRVVIGGVYGIRCTGTNQLWIHKTSDMQGSKNRHAFSITTKSCPEPGMLTDWKRYGPEAFSFEVLEELTKSETQNTKEFSDDLDVLLEMWRDKLKQ